MKNILVTGANGQLGSSIKKVATRHSGYAMHYVDVEDLDITSQTAVDAFFAERPVDICINCAAYTAVDKAESEPEKCESINADGARNLAVTCKNHGAMLIHISTDFVFNGAKSGPYKEEDPTAPLSTYGSTKELGEQYIGENISRHFIVRTSWLYSEFGHNFVKTMVRLGQQGTNLRIVEDQIGTPTYAGDLADILFQLIEREAEVDYGIYHFSNSGFVSWYGFAREIFRILDMNCQIAPIKTSEFPTAAKRPPYSVMDNSKISDALGLRIPSWEDSLTYCLDNYANKFR